MIIGACKEFADAQGANASAVFELKVRMPKMLVAEVAVRPLQTDAVANAHYLTLKRLRG